MDLGHATLLAASGEVMGWICIAAICVPTFVLVMMFILRRQSASRRSDSVSPHTANTPQITPPTQQCNIASDNSQLPSLPCNAEPLAAIRKSGEQGLDQLTRYLASRGIAVDYSRPTLTMPTGSLEQLVRFMGRHYALIHPLIKKIKRHANGTKKEINWRLMNNPHAKKRQLDFCEKLIACKLIAGYWPSPYQENLLTIAPTLTQEARKFFAGHWLELYIAVIASNIIANIAQRFQLCSPSPCYYRNLSLILPHSKKCELDGLAIVANQAYWIEVKTGEYDSDIDKFRRLAPLLGISGECFFLIQVKADRHECRKMRSEANLQICTIKEFAMLFKDRILTDLMDHGDRMYGHLRDAMWSVY